MQCFFKSQKFIYLLKKPNPASCNKLGFCSNFLSKLVEEFVPPDPTIDSFILFKRSTDASTVDLLVNKDRM